MEVPAARLPCWSRATAPTVSWLSKLGSGFRGQGLSGSIWAVSGDLSSVAHPANGERFAGASFEPGRRRFGRVGPGLVFAGLV